MALIQTERTRVLKLSACFCAVVVGVRHSEDLPIPGTNGQALVAVLGLNFVMNKYIEEEVSG